ncbi:hypothetical protein X975_22121, partial [Stegodyphus mimosarum]
MFVKKVLLLCKISYNKTKSILKYTFQILAFVKKNKLTFLSYAYKQENYVLPPH